jgi:small subunit ribosomal protein S9
MATKSTTAYTEAVGRRKTAIARVRITPAAKQSVLVNDKSSEEYFPTEILRSRAHEAFSALELPQKFSVTAKIIGGGIASQAEALRHGIARALTAIDLTHRKTLKKAGYLKRDPREKERRKFGLKKARKSKQWSKR